mmetsp:Transcript_35304/g.84352  ORF Transcript_35304/g.84352 Transcript_35304/m.84352 type:complete len:219 (+) Transcript_35304:241-897(+)
MLARDTAGAPPPAPPAAAWHLLPVLAVRGPPHRRGAHLLCTARHPASPHAARRAAAARARLRRAHQASARRGGGGRRTAPRARCRRGTLEPRLPTGPPAAATRGVARREPLESLYSRGGHDGRGSFGGGGGDERKAGGGDGGGGLPDLPRRDHKGRAARLRPQPLRRLRPALRRRGPPPLPRLPRATPAPPRAPRPAQPRLAHALRLVARRRRSGRPR